jgi:hypothetical protein
MTEPDGVVSGTVTTTPGTVTVWPLGVVTVRAGTYGIELDGTLTTVVIVS